MKAKSGMTIMEFLIALAILGVISALTIPKLLFGDSANKKAVFRESVMIMTGILKEGILADELTPDNYGNYFFDRLNALQVCPTQAVTNGCLAPSSEGATTDTQNDQFGAVVLPSGAVIHGITDTNSAENCTNCDTAGGEWGNGIQIDWNGNKGPNRVGQDRLWLIDSFGTKPLAPPRYTATPLQPSQITVVTSWDGTVVPWSVADNVALYKEIYDLD